MLEQINIKRIKDMNFVKMIGDEWNLITAGNVNDVNTMTASWGNIGFMWGKPSATVYVRQTRYTKEFLDNNEYFSICFFEKKYKKDLAYLGSHSGRDEDKIAKVNFTVDYIDNVPYFQQASLIIVCKKMYAQKMEKENILNPEILERYYEKESIHTLYIGEIKHTYLNK